MIEICWTKIESSCTQKLWHYRKSMWFRLYISPENVKYYEYGTTQTHKNSIFLKQSH